MSKVTSGATVSLNTRNTQERTVLLLFMYKPRIDENTVIILNKNTGRIYSKRKPVNWVRSLSEVKSRDIIPKNRTTTKK